MPKRIQLKRTKGWRKPKGAVVVSRPSKWGNPYPVNIARGIYPVDVVKLFRAYLGRHPGLIEDARRELRGKDLACWCPLDRHCHADVLLEVANARSLPDPVQ